MESKTFKLIQALQEIQDYLDLCQQEELLKYLHVSFFLRRPLGFSHKMRALTNSGESVSIK